MSGLFLFVPCTVELSNQFVEDMKRLAEVFERANTWKSV